MAAFRASVVQLSAGPDKTTNLARALRWIDRAHAAGAKLVVLPENFLFRGTDREFKDVPETLAGPSCAALSERAKLRNLHVLAGSFAEKIPGSSKTYNTSCLIGPRGQMLAVYRKIHLFDVDLPGKKIRESDRCAKGKKPVLGRMRIGGRELRCGLSICYDLRFPELYRQYARQGADLMFVPSNFTRQTGQDHWEPLVRARAIENQCFVLAPGQSGVGSQGVLTHGNSLIVDPWGRILTKASGSGEALLTARLDMAELVHVRRILPALSEAF